MLMGEDYMEIDGCIPEESGGAPPPNTSNSNIVVDDNSDTILKVASSPLHQYNQQNFLSESFPPPKRGKFNSVVPVVLDKHF